MPIDGDLMAHHTRHPSDVTLLRAVDGEISRQESTRLDRHLADCGPCRARRQRLQEASDEFLLACNDDLAARAPVAQALRDRMRVRLTDLSSDLNRSWRSRLVQWLAGLRGAALDTALLGAAVVAIVSTVVVVRHRPSAVTPDDLVAVEPGALPVPSLTPGATRPVFADELCAGAARAERPIATAVRQAVLRDYRMEKVPAHEYELDYLITPELGGSADRRNLWPERYGARVWNARVKDELEQLLPQLVCRGQVDLATAQRDIAANWIAAYQKYFHTDRPLGTRVGTSWKPDDVPMFLSFATPAGSLGPRPRS
jgi:hypothetical protein